MHTQVGKKSILHVRIVCRRSQIHVGGHGILRDSRRRTQFLDPGRLGQLLRSGFRVSGAGSKV